MPPAPNLDDFALKPVPHTGLFGVFLAAHALYDALHVLHTGVGCKGKTQRQLVDHDLGREAHARVGWTELGEAELIRDAAAPLADAGVELHRRRRPALMLVTSSTAVEFTGAELETQVAALADRVDCPVVHLPGVARLPDLYAGYSAVLSALVDRVDWNRAADERPTVSMVGHLFHRFEVEQAANLAECNRLLQGLGARLGPGLLGGLPVAQTLQMHRAAVLLRMPYSQLDAADLEGRARRRTVEVPLPLGMGGTQRWLAQAGAGLGLADGRVQELVDRERARAAPRLETARRVLAGKRVAVVADTALAAGLVGLCLEVGLQPALVALLDRSMGGQPRLDALLADCGHQLPQACVVIEDPSLMRLRELAGAETGRTGNFDLALRPDLGLSGTAWQALPTVEIGFPAHRKHFLFPMPEFGFSGAVALAQRMLDAVRRAH